MATRLTREEIRRRVLGREVMGEDDEGNLMPFEPDEEADTRMPAPITDRDIAVDDFGGAAIPDRGRGGRSAEGTAAVPDRTTGTGSSRSRQAATPSLRPTRDTFLRLAAESGRPVRSLDDLRGGNISPLEGRYYFPFDNPNMGGVSQASRNIASLMGLKPASGNPYDAFMEKLIPGLYASESVRAAQAGESQTEGDLANRIKDLLSSGRTSALDNPVEAIRALRDAPTPEEGDTSPLAMLMGQVSDREDAAGLLAELLAPVVSPFLRGGLRRSLQDRLMRYHNDAPNRPGVGPFRYLAEGV